MASALFSFSLATILSRIRSFEQKSISYNLANNVFIKDEPSNLNNYLGELVLALFWQWIIKSNESEK